MLKYTINLHHQTMLWTGFEEQNSRTLNDCRHLS